MTRPHHERLLAYTAERAQARPEYLAWVLRRYVKLEGISEEELIQHLGITTGDKAHLALCLRPRAASFAADVRQISSRFNINPATLAAVVRLVESVEALASGDAGEGSVDAGLLMAARARQQTPKPAAPEPHDHDHPNA